MTINQDKSIDDGNKALSNLLGSETRAKILKILILNDKNSYRLSDLSKQTDMDISGVHREITNLIELNIINTKEKTKNPEYKINSNHVFFKGLLEIFKKADSLSKKYFLFEDMPVGYPAIGCDYLNINRINNYLKNQSLKSKLSKSLSIYKYPNLKFFFCHNECVDLSKEILEKLIKNPKFGIKNIKEVIELSNKLFNLSEEIEEQNYTEFSNQKILKLLKKYHSIYEEVHISGWIGNSSDMPDMLFTKHLLFILQERIRKKGSLLNPQDAFSKLTTPREDSFMQKEHNNMLKILIEIYANSHLKKIFKKLEPRHILKEIKGKKIGYEIEKHAQDYGWIGYGFIGPCWDEIYFIGIMSSLVKQDKDPLKMLEEIKQNKEDLIKEQEKIINSLELNEHDRELFEVARGVIFTKGYRKDSMFKLFSRIELFYREISRRLHLSLTDIRFCFPHEFDKLMSSNSEFIKKLKERQKFSVCESTGSYKDDLYLNGEDAKKYIEKLPFEKEESTNVSVLNGICACPGRVRGKVKIINIPKEMDKMNKGDVLISIATSPDLVPAMKKAAAIATDMGGITSHAAIVSRELNVPCVVGTKIATKVLKDNVLVEVDATHGVVRILK
jgi:phosphohistidine swiveling domain-containing protein